MENFKERLFDELNKNSIESSDKEFLHMTDSIHDEEIVLFFETATKEYVKLFKGFHNVATARKSTMVEEIKKYVY